MKAVRLSRTGGPEVLDHVDLPTPDPGDGEVLAETEAAGTLRMVAPTRRGRVRGDARPFGRAPIEGRAAMGKVVLVP